MVSEVGVSSNAQALSRRRRLACAAVAFLGWTGTVGFGETDPNRAVIEAVPPIRGLVFDRQGRVLAENLPLLFIGSLLTESFFGIPGLGSYFVQGALNRDYTLVMGVVVFYGIVIILLNFIVDLVYAGLNPRIRYDEGR